MRHILIAAGLVIGVSGTAVAESSDTATINMTGNVEQICTVVPNSGVAGANGGAANHSYSVSDDTVTFDFDFLINNTDDPSQATIGQTNQAFFSIAFDTFCNDDFNWTTEFTNGAMTTSAAAPSGFTNSMSYKATIKQNGTQTFANGYNPASGPASYNSGPYDGTSQIDFNVVPSTTPPVAGDYVETVTVTFAADA